MAPVIVTMVRHGESKDNLSNFWAGHRDAPLSNHGNTQALRLGQAFADVPITAIYASDLNRANTTARRVWEVNKERNGGIEVPFTTSPLLREQFFGEAEGAPWDAGRYSSAHMPWEDHRAFQLSLALKYWTTERRQLTPFGTQDRAARRIAQRCCKTRRPRPPQLCRSSRPRDRERTARRETPRAAPHHAFRAWNLALRDDVLVEAGRRSPSPLRQERRLPGEDLFCLG